jgi:transcriptional regulator with GAF, ATPase, and Fis domain
MQLWNMVHPDFREMVRERLNIRLNKGGLRARFEVKIVAKTGEERWADFTAGMTVYEGKPAGIVTLFDITKQKRERKLDEIVYKIAQAQDIRTTSVEFYTELHSLIQEIMTAGNFYVALYDAESGLWSFPYFVDEVEKAASPKKLGKGMLAYILRTGKSLLCTQGVAEELKKHGEIDLVEMQSKIWLGVPLLIGDQKMGVLVVQDYSNVNCYNTKQQHMLEFISNQVAKTIDSRRSIDALLQNKEKPHRLS